MPQMRLPTRVGVVLGLLLTGLTATPAEAAVRAEPSCAPEAVTGALAVAEATRCGVRIEDLSLRTETGQVFANPDGTLTSVQTIIPVRARTAGGWQPIDTSLRFDADGGVIPGRSRRTCGSPEGFCAAGHARRT